MKRSLTISVFSLCALARFAAAGPADLSKEVRQESAPKPFSWEGGYLGLNIGGMFGTSHANDTRSYLTPVERAESWDYDTSGFTGGIQAGYNWQRNWLVAGMESDIGYLNVDGSGSSPVVRTVVSSTESDFYSTLRGRLGFASGRWLFYVTGGAILFDYNVSINDSTFSNSVSHWAFRPGWTIGGGAEWALNDRWSLKAEYLYFETENGSVDLRAVTSPGGRSDNEHFFFDHYSLGHIVRAGINYHFGGPEPHTEMMPATDKSTSGKNVMQCAPFAPEFTWTGLYAGLHAGWGLGGLEWNDEAPETNEHVADTYQHGIFGGLQAGVNYQLGWLVVGTEGTFSGSDIGKDTAGLFNINGGTDFGQGGTAKTQIDWIATVAARIGVVCPHILDGRLLTYGKVGMSDAHIEYEGNRTANAANSVNKHFNGNEGRFAPVIGGGFEYALNNHWTARIEYDFANYGSKIIRGIYDESGVGFRQHEDEQYETKFRLHTVEAAINYKF